MNLTLNYTDCVKINGTLTVSGSKSESNRLLILQKLYPTISIGNLSDSDDSMHLKSALLSKNKTIDIGHAGTAMRFLTAYLATQTTGASILTGSKRMQNRPIKILVDALRDLGATIEYVDKEGYPPILIKGMTVSKNTLSINGNVSSQYLSALLLITPKLKNGLKLNLKGTVTSRPYLEMTLSLLHAIGVETKWQDNCISVFPKKTIEPKRFTVESDWSSASYFYSLVALSKEASITLTSYKKNSLQGDNALVTLYKNLGVETTFKDNTITLIKNVKFKAQDLELDLVNAPDLAQTIAVTCFGLGIACNLKGLHTLKIKETDRLVALKTELEKLGAQVEITDNSLFLYPATAIKSNVKIATYKDHRMAMAFAPLALKVPLIIEDADVVSKSYPQFWKDLEDILH